MAAVFLMASVARGMSFSRVFVLIFVFMLSACESLLFFPQQQLVRSPADVGLAYADVRIAIADGGTVSAWWLPAEGKAEATVLFAHGNAENISTHLASVYWLPARGINVLLIDYRGYGQSSGEASVRGAQMDILAALQHLSAQPAQANTPIVVLGQSIGASLAGVAVARNGRQYPALAGVILDAGFTGYADIAKKVAASNWLTWSFQCLAAWTMPEGENLLDEISAISPLPLLLIHGRDDPVVPYRHAERLLAAAKQPKTLISYEGGHIQTFSRAENRDLVAGFIRDAAERWRASRKQ